MSELIQYYTISLISPTKRTFRYIDINYKRPSVRQEQTNNTWRNTQEIWYVMLLWYHWSLIVIIKNVSVQRMAIYLLVFLEYPNKVLKKVDYKWKDSKILYVCMSYVCEIAYNYILINCVNKNICINKQLMDLFIRVLDMLYKKN